MKKFKLALCIFALILALFVISGCKPETDTPEVSDDGTSEEQGPIWLDAPENLKLEGFTLSFDAVEGAKGYLLDISGRVYIPETRETVYSLERETTENIIDLTTTLSPGESYSISVYALGTYGDVITDSDPTTIDVITEGVTPGLEFILNDDGESYTVSKGTSKTAKHLIFPDTYNGKPITKLTGHFGRYDLSTAERPMLGIYYLRLPCGLEEIDQYAFNELAIEELTLPNTLRKIGDQVFRECKNLTTVHWPSSLREIGKGAFAVTGIKRLVLPEGVESVGVNAFAASKLESFELPRTLWLIDKGAFSNTPWYQTQPDGPIYIGRTFYEYKNESDQKLPSEIVIREGTLYIAEMAFYQNQDITRVVLPEGLLGIQDRAFEGCSALTDIALPSTLKSIGLYAFLGSHITEVTLPAGIEYMENGVFMDCPMLRRVTVESGIKRLFNSTFSNCSALSELILPDTVEYIEAYAITGTQIKRIALPAGLKELGNYAFASSSALIEVDTSKATSLVSIGTRAFVDCPLLTSISIPDSVEILGNAIFNGTAITEIKLPENLISLGAIFEGMGIKSVILPSKLQKIEKNAFKNCADLTSVVFPNTLTEIGMSAFEGCTSLLTVVFSNNLTTIYVSAFKNCVSLTEIELPNSVTTLGTNVFAGCTSLKIAVLSNEITQIPTSAFEGCTSLVTLKLPSKLHTIGTRAFQNCTSLGEVTFPSTLKIILNSAFYNCTSMSLSNSRLPSGLEKIYNAAFYNCKGITEVILPDSLKSLMTLAFAGTSISYLDIPSGISEFLMPTISNCNNLEYIVIPKSVTKISLIKDIPYDTITIYYEGSKSDMNLINVFMNSNGENQEVNDISSVVQNIYYYSSTKPTTEGKYWCYEGNIIKKYY